MSEQTRRAFIRHFVRALAVGDPATIADYFAAAADHDRTHLDEPSLVDELNAIQQAQATAA